ncbi:MAG: hypothetical protein J6Q06_05630 [Clostridia bacterium]|nr:hypothetical protein [Clostridia bacterium]
MNCREEKNKYKSWSNLKKQLSELLCDSLKEKVSYFYTNYHNVHNVYGRATINYDKKELVEFAWVDRYVQESEEYGEFENLPKEELEAKWMSEGKLSDYDFIQSATSYLNVDVADALNSKDYLHKIFAYMDRRVGKRTLLKIKDEVKDLPQWVQQFYQLRCEADGLTEENK